MPRKLKTYQTSLGFYDLAVAAPSMKAALKEWGAGSNLFHQGFAKETDDPDVIAATMAQPGVVLKRPAGSSGRFAEQAGLPADLADGYGENKGRRSKIRKSRPATKVGEKEARKAAAAFEREQRRQDTERRREEAARAKEGQGARIWLRKRRQHWTRRSGSTKNGPKLSWPNGPPSRSGSMRKMRAGKASGSG